LELLLWKRFRRWKSRQ